MKNKLRKTAICAAALALTLCVLCMGGCWHNGGYEVKGNFADGSRLDRLDKKFESAIGLTSDKIFVDLSLGDLTLYGDGTLTDGVLGPRLYLRYKEPKHNVPYEVICFINYQRMSLANRKEYKSDKHSHLPSLYDLWELVYGINAGGIEEGGRIEFILSKPTVVKYDWEDYGYGLKEDTKEYFVSAKEVNKDNYSGYALLLSGAVLPSIPKGEEHGEGIFLKGKDYKFIKPLKYHDVL